MERLRDLRQLINDSGSAAVVCKESRCYVDCDSLSLSRIQHCICEMAMLFLHVPENYEAAFSVAVLTYDVAWTVSCNHICGVVVLVVQWESGCAGCAAGVRMAGWLHCSTALSFHAVASAPPFTFLKYLIRDPRVPHLSSCISTYINSCKSAEDLQFTD